MTETSSGVPKYYKPPPKPVKDDQNIFQRNESGRTMKICFVTMLVLLFILIAIIIGYFISLAISKKNNVTN